jgi:hypothetical protein
MSAPHVPAGAAAACSSRASGCGRGSRVRAATRAPRAAAQRALHVCAAAPPPKVPLVRARRRRCGVRGARGESLAARRRSCDP